MGQCEKIKELEPQFSLHFDELVCFMREAMPLMAQAAAAKSSRSHSRLGDGSSKKRKSNSEFSCGDAAFLPVADKDKTNKN